MVSARAYFGNSFNLKVLQKTIIFQFFSFAAEEGISMVVFQSLKTIQ